MFLLQNNNNIIKYVLHKTNIKYVRNYLMQNYNNKTNNTFKISNLKRTITTTTTITNEVSSTKSTIPSNQQTDFGSPVSAINHGKRINSSGGGDWINIYQLPVIQFMASLNKLKIYQTIFAGTTIPLSYGLAQLNYIDIGFVQTFSVLGVSGCITLYLFGLCTKNLIGRVYVKQNTNDDDVNLIKLSYINFWGYRKDIEVPQNQILLSVNTKKFNIFYRNVHSFETNQSYKLMIPPFGTVLNPELFIDNIGKI